MKPKVHYRELATTPQVGIPCYLYPVDHYATDRVSNTKMVRTSHVVKVMDNGEFETKNTHYVPYL